MKAIRFHEYGGPSVLRLEEVPKPSAGEGQVLIEVKAAGVSFADVLQRRNQYPIPQQLPITPGFTVGGLVDSVGEGVHQFKKGDRVFGLPVAGGCSDYALAAASMVFPLPEAISFEVATALPGQALSVFLMLDEAELKPGQSVAVTAASGALGSMAAQIAKLKGAGKVYGITGHARKLAGLRTFGYDAGFSTDQPDWANQLLNATEGAGVDIYLDSVGGEVFTEGLKLLNVRGTAVAFGYVSGKSANLDPLSLLMKNQCVRGFSIGTYMFQPDLVQKGMEALMVACITGQLQISVTSYPLTEAAKVYQDMEDRKTSGKVVLTP